MNIIDIRKQTAFDPSAMPTQKEAARNWLRGMHTQYPIALTLTLRQTTALKTASGVCYQSITKDDCHRIAERFKKKLNQQVFGHAAKRHGKSLTYIVVIEGERSCKRLHLHMAIGNLPAHVKFNQLNALVTEAKVHVDNVDEQHKLDITDSGWMEYITKELGHNDTDNVLWDLA